MKRAVILVIDSMGIGAMPDAAEYNDSLECNTFVNVAEFNNGLKLPNFQKLGLGNIQKIKGMEYNEKPLASFGKMTETSMGKDTTTGHWEIAGIVLKEPFNTYPQGFPVEIINEFIEKTGCKAILANYPSSGTEILEKLGDEHVKTGYPIIYTSADSVFQIACHVDKIPLETLYNWCKIARSMLGGKYNVSRVIARPFEGESGNYKRISKDRRDYSLVPPEPTLLNHIVDAHGMVFGVGKIEDIFVKAGITHSVHTGSNKEGLEYTLKIIKRQIDFDEYALKDKDKKYSKELVFVNLVDTDMLYGHRNDPVGYGKAIEEIDFHMAEIINSLTDEDLLIITADHGCDPTQPGTDHTREYVPLLVYGKNQPAKNLEVRTSFTDIAKTVSEWLNVKDTGIGESFFNIKVSK
ncbi:MAG: phosphopentomutase [Candidatus Gastranaerophilaceae bacterium]|jgi:phosphopentomutase